MRLKHLVLVAAIACAISAAHVDDASIATAQEVADLPMTPELALARICWHEEGVYVTEGCAAIDLVIERVARVGHHSYVEAARAYSGRVFDPERRDQRQYVAYLQPFHAIRGRGQPPYWPTQWYERTRVRGELVMRVVPHAPWIAFRERWAEILLHAARIIDGQVTHVCELPSVSHWGGLMDRDNADLQALQPVYCGSTRNIFYITAEEYESLGRPTLRGDQRHERAEG